MFRTIRVVSAMAGVLALTPSIAAARDPSCTALYEAARKAHAQPGVERVVTLGDPAKPTMTMVARKTVAGWFQQRSGTPWRAMPFDPEATEKTMLEDPGAFAKCTSAGTESVNGEAARVWNYVTLVGPAPVASRMWISVSRGLPLKVAGDKTLQISTYQATPFPKP